MRGRVRETVAGLRIEGRHMVQSVTAERAPPQNEAADQTQAAHSFQQALSKAGVALNGPSQPTAPPANNNTPASKSGPPPGQTASASREQQIDDWVAHHSDSS